MFNLTQEPQNVFKIIWKSFSLYKYTFPRIVFWCVAIVLLKFFMIFGESFFFQILSNEYNNATSTFAFLGGAIAIVLLNLIIILFIFISISAIFHDLHETMLNQNPSIKSAFNAALKVCIPVFFTSLMLIVIFGGLGVLWVWTTSTFSGVISFLFAIGIPIMLVYLSINALPVIPLIITEGLNPFTAIKLSVSLVWGNWWRVFFTFLILLIVPTIINFLIFYGISKNSAPNLESSLFLIGISAIIFDIIYTPWIYSVVLLQIHNLKLLKQQKTNE